MTTCPWVSTQALLGVPPCLGPQTLKRDVAGSPVSCWASLGRRKASLAVRWDTLVSHPSCEMYQKLASLSAREAMTETCGKEVLSLATDG